MVISPSADEVLRLQALSRYGVLDTPPEPAFDTIVALAARLLAAPITQITFVDARRCWAKAAVGDYPREVSCESALCTLTLEDAETLIISDLVYDGRFSENPPCVGTSSIRFYAGIPLRTPEGFGVGTLFVADFAPRQLTPADRAHVEATLHDLSRLVMAQLDERRKALEAKAGTERHQREEATLRNQQQWRAQTLGEERTCFLTLDPQGIIREWEPSAAEFFGYPAPQAIGRSFVELVVPPEWHRRYARALGMCCEAIEKDALADATREASSGEAGMPDANAADENAVDSNTRACRGRRVKMLTLRPEGGTRYIQLGLARLGSDAAENRAGPEGAEGAAEAEPLLRACVRDVDEEERSQEWLSQLEMVVNNANDAILITEAEPTQFPGPRILYCNEAFTRMSGYTLPEIIGRTPRMMHGKNTDPVSRDKIRQALRRWKPVLVEIMNYRKDGTPFWVELSIVPVKDETGWWTHWISIQRDITSRKRVEQELQRAHDAAIAARSQADDLRREAEVANHAKSEFLSRMSHELRTPLNAILGFAQLLQMDVQDEEQSESIEHILKGGSHLLNLINEILDIARIEAGRIDLLLETLSLAGLVGEVVALVNPLATRAGVRLTALPTAGEIWVHADQQRLKQVLLNLLSNAVKYNRAQGSVEIEVGTGETIVSIAVRDTGLGIAPDKLKDLFVPFERLGADRTNIEGTGLGLALSKHLLEAMHGTLEVQSAPGQGSEFTIVMPRSFDFERTPEPQEVPRSAAQFVPSQRTVLYIEENPANFTLVHRLFSRRPHIELLTATSGEAGLELARKHRPDLILLDLHLPDGSGEDVLRRMRDDLLTRDLPVMIVSADATPERIARLLSAGAQDYATKPIDVPHFLARVDALLDARKPREMQHANGTGSYNTPDSGRSANGAAPNATPLSLSSYADEK